MIRSDCAPGKDSEGRETRETPTLGVGVSAQRSYMGNRSLLGSLEDC